MTRFDPRSIGATAALALLLTGCQKPPPAGWSGYVEGDYVLVAAPVAGTLTKLAVRCGQTVATGAALFTLDDVSARAANDEAQARVTAAQAQADNGRSGQRTPQLAVTQAQLAQAQAAAQRADTELQRQQQLVTQNFISRSRLDDAVTAARQAHDHVAELQAALRSGELPAARPEELKAAQANTEAAKQALAQAAWRAQQARQSAPAAGLVADTFFREGEYVPAGQPVLSLLPPERRKARFYVPEAELGGLRVGQAVSLGCDGCGAPIAARISYLSPQAEYTPPVIYSNAQRAKLVFLVEAVPAAADALRLQPGQPLDVRTGSALRAASAP